MVSPVRVRVPPLPKKTCNDVTAKHYVYGKTDKAWWGTCRQLVLGFKDSKSQPVNWKFTK